MTTKLCGKIYNHGYYLLAACLLVRNQENKCLLLAHVPFLWFTAPEHVLQDVTRRLEDGGISATSLEVELSPSQLSPLRYAHFLSY